MVNNCKHCGKEFVKNHHCQIYCSKSCNKKVDYIKNRERYKEKARLWREENYERHLKKRIEYYQKNREVSLEKMKEYERRPEVRERIRKIRKEKYYNIPEYRINHAIGRAIRKTLNGEKGVRTNDIVGYTPDKLRKKLEQQFTEDMSWENWGELWHIDHRIPSSWFNIQSIDDPMIKHCWALENLQPKNAFENMSKQNKFAEPTEKQLEDPIYLEILNRNGYKSKNI